MSEGKTALRELIECAEKLQLFFLKREAEEKLNGKKGVKKKDE